MNSLASSNSDENAVTKKPNGIYADHIRDYLKASTLTSYEECPKELFDLWRKGSGKKSSQVKRVAWRYFHPSTRKVGKPGYPKTMQILNDWCQRFMVMRGRIPRQCELLEEGRRVKSLHLPQLSIEGEWQCSKGWAKKFIIRLKIAQHKQDET